MTCIIPHFLYGTIKFIPSFGADVKDFAQRRPQVRCGPRGGSDKMLQSNPSAATAQTIAGCAVDPRRWLVLPVLLVGAMLAPLDFFIVNVALPAIRTGLN